MIHGIMTGNRKSLNNIVKKYADDNHFTPRMYQLCKKYVQEQHVIAKAFPQELYNLNSVEVTCRVWEDRWYEGK